jgi:formylglycine-generating enzyme required for sulfatase activity
VPPQGKVETRVNPVDGAEMVFIPAGSFEMGDADMPSNPRRTVQLSAYWIYKNDVTVAEYRKFCDATGGTMPQAPPWGWSDNNPIVNVTWDNAIAYAKWAGMDLPTEAQWEKAARGTDGRKYPWGNEWDASRCVHSVDENGASPPADVGSHTDNPYGLSDMAGNVWQWCQDKYDKDFWTSDAAKRTDPENEAIGDPHVLRGGSWVNYNPELFRCALRNWLRVPADGILGCGFRCAARLGSSAAPAAGIPRVTAPAPEGPILHVKTCVNRKDNAEMILIPAGPFEMGDNDQNDNPLHTVTLSAYWIYKNDVTVAQYRKFCAATGHSMPAAPSWGWGADNPIVHVSWDDAMAYATWARVDLPTEAQWEKAARGTDGRQYPWGDEFEGSKLWFNQERTTDVGQYAVNLFGCTDMAGNVCQWCKDRYAQEFWKSGRANCKDPENEIRDWATGDTRVVRGGNYGWSDAATFRCARRGHGPPGNRFDGLGFRCAARPNSH